MPTIHPGAFVCCVDDLFVALFTTAVAADTLSVGINQSASVRFITPGAALLGLPLPYSPEA